MFASNLTQFRRIGFRRGLFAVALPLVAAFVLLPEDAIADVTVYDRAPSVEELQQKLLGGGKADKKQYKTRAIVFDDTPPAQAAPSQAQTNAPQAPSVPAAATQYAPPPQPASHAQSVQVSENAIAFPIQFKVNSSQILPESLPFLQSIAGLMQKEPGVRILVEGHTDVSGSYQRNVSLSRERAFSVMNHLIDRFGLDPMRFMPVGKGPSDPLHGLDPADPKNRRVQFRIIG
jgi:outer membrane protein OmpA-like peptidoglycan-associated protein